MPLQNRVDPFGDISAHPARGLFTGNRGVIHDPATKTLLRRRWTTKAWIVCRCEFRGRRREVMGSTAPSGRAGWTELFFLDEVTALAAGHRPCFYCRREDAIMFARCFAAAQGLVNISASGMDAILHRQRRACGAPAIELPDFRSLPDGTMLAIGGVCYVIRGPQLCEWSFDGYRLAAHPQENATIALLTPPATVAALAAGYRPVWHPSAS